jgi:hypothetical protein
MPRSYFDMREKQAGAPVDYEVRAVAFEAYADARANKQQSPFRPGQRHRRQARRLLERIHKRRNGLRF